MGLPTAVGSSRNETFKFLKDKLWARIHGWIEKCLLVAGKEVLVKAVAQAITTSSMSCFKLTRGLCEHLNGMLHKFWQGSKNGERMVASVSWSGVTQVKNMGGQGFRDVEFFNLLMLEKQA